MSPLGKPAVACLVVLMFVGSLSACEDPGILPDSLGKWRPSFFHAQSGQKPSSGEESDSLTPVDLNEDESTDADNGTTEPGAEVDPDEPSEPVSENTYLVKVDVSQQKVRILKDMEVIKDFICSTGVEGNETPLGEFQIQNRGTWFFSDKYKQGAMYWVSFKDWGVYLFHSVAMDKNREIIPEEEAKLGTPASHGCVRLPVEDAKWIYDNIPARTKVLVHE